MSDVHVRLILDGDRVIAIKPNDEKPEQKPKVPDEEERNGPETEPC